MSETMEDFLGDGPTPYKGTEGLLDWLRAVEVGMTWQNNHVCPQCDITIAHHGATRREKLSTLPAHGPQCPISHLYTAIVGILFSEEAVRERGLRPFPEPCRECHLRGGGSCPRNKWPREECPELLARSEHRRSP